MLLSSFYSFYRGTKGSRGGRNWSGFSAPTGTSSMSHFFHADPTYYDNGCGYDTALCKSVCSKPSCFVCLKLQGHFLWLLRRKKEAFGYHLVRRTCIPYTQMIHVSVIGIISSQAWKDHSPRPQRIIIGY